LRFAELLRDYQMDLLWSTQIAANPLRPSTYMLSFSEGGAVLPTRDQYSDPNVVTRYQTHIARILELAGQAVGHDPTNASTTAYDGTRAQCTHSVSVNGI
jgi:hypothetical protein